MENIVSVDQTAPWRNDPDAMKAHRALREWNVLDRKERELTVVRHSTLEAKQATIIAYGAALIEGRKRYPADRDFHRWIEDNRLNLPPFSDPKERSNTMRIAGLGSNLNLAGCPESWPSNIVKWLRKTGVVQPKRRTGEATAAARDRVRLAVENGEPIGRNKIAEEIGTHNSTVDIAIALERGRHEGIVESEAVVLNEQGKFTKAQAKHVEALIKKYRRDLDSQFKAAVEVQVDKRVKERRTELDKAREAVSKQLNEAFKDQQHWRQLINNRKPIFTGEEYRDLLLCTHEANPSEETRKRAFIALNVKKLQLIGKP